jgi:hypothetical protein
VGVEMNNENGTVHATIEDIFHTANNELFSHYKLSYLSSQLAPSPAETAEQNSVILSIINASAEGIKILSTINIGESTARYIYPGDGANAALEELQDLCGELNNQLIGKVKNKMLAYDCKLMLGLPTCITGKSVSSHAPQSATLSERIYTSAEGEVVVCLYTVIHPDFTMLDVANVELAGEVSEGTLSFF